MVLRAVAVGLAGLLAAGCMKRQAPPPVVPVMVVVVDGVGHTGDAPLSSFETPDHSPPWTSRDEVEVEWHGSWWPAVLMDKRGARWLVHYEGYTDDWDEVVGAERIRERRMERSSAEPSESEDEPDP